MTAVDSRARAARFGRGLLLVSAPAALGILELTHPSWRSGTVYQALAPRVGWWVSLHVLLLACFALVALAVYQEVGGRRSPAAVAARLALGLFVVCNSAFIAIDGVATGVLIQPALSLTNAQQAGVEQAIQAMWGSPVTNTLYHLGQLGWTVSLLAAAFALYPLKAWRVPLVGLAVALAVSMAQSLGILPKLGPWTWTAGVLIGVLTAVSLVYRAGMSHLAWALLVPAALLPQHAGVAALAGTTCLLLALGWRVFVEPRRSALRQAGPGAPPADHIPREGVPVGGTI